MQLWTNFLDWLTSDEGWRITSGAIIPFVAILVAGIIAAAIGRGSAKRIVALSDRDIRFAAVTALIGAARKSAVYNTLPAPEQHHLEHLVGEADTKVRLLATPGAAMAADWAAHELFELRKNAVSFSFQAEQSLNIFRDRLIEWQAHPSRAKRLFKNDLEAWAYDESSSDRELVNQQQAWASQQSADGKDLFSSPADPATEDIYSTVGLKDSKA
jgi:hypothetical protein